jgi:hypothetical protein
MKEQWSIKMCPRQPTAERHSVLFLALPTTPAVFTGIGFSNPDQAWTHALKDDRGTGALPAAEPAPEASQSMLPESINGSLRRLASRLASRRPCLCKVGGSPMDGPTE